jgi:predicted DNA-binding protein with PD1-like motif
MKTKSPTLLVPPSGPITAHCFRLHPNDALMPSLKQAASIILSRIPENTGGSAFVITAVGSLKDVTLRLANASRTDGDENGGNDIKRYMRRFEIVSLTGTFSRNDGCHIHISLADAEGNTIGGHLVDGVVFTTCEVVLGTADGVEFVREMDRETGYRELVSIQLPQPNAGQSIMNKIATVILIAAVGCIVGRLRFK